jgi:hypothetical protein
MQGKRDDSKRPALPVRRADGALVGVFNLTDIIRGPLQQAFLGYYAFAPHAARATCAKGCDWCWDSRSARQAASDRGEHPAAKRASIGWRACGFSREGYSPRYLKTAALAITTLGDQCGRLEGAAACGRNPLMRARLSLLLLAPCLLLACATPLNAGRAFASKVLNSPPARRTNPVPLLAGDRLLLRTRPTRQWRSRSCAMTGRRCFVPAARTERDEAYLLRAADRAILPGCWTPPPDDVRGRRCCALTCT